MEEPTVGSGVWMWAPETVNFGSCGNIVPLNGRVRYFIYLLAQKICTNNQ